MMGNIVGVVIFLVVSLPVIAFCVKDVIDDFQEMRERKGVTSVVTHGDEQGETE